MMAGRYDKTTNIDVYLKAHAGDPLTVDRIGRPPNHIPNPRLTMLLSVQPNIISGVMSNNTFRGRGLCGRYLYAICKSKVGHRDIDPPPVPENVKGAYRATIRRMLADQTAGQLHCPQRPTRSDGNTRPMLSGG